MNCNEKSIRKIARKLGFSLFSPVLTGIVPPSSIPLRLKFAETFQKTEPNFHRKPWYSDETHFDTLEELNQKIISKERPSLDVSGVQKERFPKRCTLWGAMHYEYGLIWYTNFTNAKKKWKGAIGATRGVVRLKMMVGDASYKQSNSAENDLPTEKLDTVSTDRINIEI